MKYKLNGSDVISNEHEIQDFWKKEHIFQRSLEKTQSCEAYVMYDGPPFATGLPHYGHVLAHTIKDVFPRLQTMTGKYVARSFGWDCHGVPVEHMVQQQFMDEGIAIDTSTPEGIAQFNERCQSVVLKYTHEWKQTEERFGRFVDMDHPYKTMDPEYIESVWSVFASLNQKGLVDERLRVVAYSPALHTAFSDFEAKENYKKLRDPAITIAFSLIDESNTDLLVWTTTPWTVITNIAVAINPDLDYVKVTTQNNHRYIIAASLVAKNFKEEDIKEVSPISSAEVIGKRYRPMFPTSNGAGAHEYTVISSAHVTAQDGTGLVHISPAFGEDDFKLSPLFSLPVLDFFDAEGQYESINNYADSQEYSLYQSFFEELRGVNFKDADKRIVRFIKELGRLHKHEILEHEYPCCWRTDKPLMYRAMPSWYVNVTGLKERMIELNKKINWYPDTVGTKRFNNWLENARDWNISRDRFWGAPIPIWRNIDDPQDIIVIGSKAELEALSHQVIPDDLHRQYVDSVEIVRDGKTYKRIPQVFDCWFESGSMPYAQVGYKPHQATVEEKEIFQQKHFPADFIAEGLDQTRGWFYTLLILSTALFDSVPFRNCVVNGILLGSDKKKMSKSKRNYPSLDGVLEQYGADALRYVLMRSPATCAESMSVSEDLFKQATSDLLIPIKNIFRFFADICNSNDLDISAEFELDSIEKIDLDAWLLIRTENFKRDIIMHLDRYDLIAGCNDILSFIQEFSRWYVRNIKSILARSTNEQKCVSMSCMHFALDMFAKFAAPIIPFSTEYLYRSLRGDNMSVHLESRPTPRLFRDEITLQQQFERVETARQIVTLIYGLRESNNIPLKQPLSKITLDESLQESLNACLPLILDATNVEAVQWGKPDDRFQFKVSLSHSIVGPKLRRDMQAVNALIQREEYILNSDKTELTVRVKDSKSQEEKMYVLQQDAGDFSIVPAASNRSIRSSTIWVELDTDITVDLRQKGNLRALEHEIMMLRKEHNLARNHKIYLHFSGEIVNLLKNDRDRFVFCEHTNATFVELDSGTKADQVLEINKLNGSSFSGSAITLYIRNEKIYSERVSSSTLFSSVSEEKSAFEEKSYASITY